MTTRRLTPMQMLFLQCELRTLELELRTHLQPVDGDHNEHVFAWATYVLYAAGYRP